MSCGGLHGLDDHGTHEHDGPEVIEDTGPEEDAVPEKKKEPGVVSVLWRSHKGDVVPFAWLPGADLAGLTSYLVSSGDWVHADLATLSMAAIAEGAIEVRNWKTKRSPFIRNRARLALAGAASWSMLASGLTMTGWQGIVQWSLLAGVAIGGGVHVYDMRHGKKKEPEQEEVTEEQPEPAGPEVIVLPPIDPRQLAFERRFCEGPHAELKGANVTAFTDHSNDGFSLELIFSEESKHTVGNVQSAVLQIARLYDTTADCVEVSYVPHYRSERRAQVTVTAAARPDRPIFPVRWDGKSTYNPATGMVDLGRFLDDAITHYRFNKPRSGAMMGMAAGAPDSGKTGSIHVLAAEAGLAKLCSRTVDGVCPCKGSGECDMQRMIAVLLADPQNQPLGVWKRRADIMGWTPEGSMELLQFVATLATERQKDRGEMKWTDHEGRENEGQGWWDPVPGFPLVFFGFDEWPMMITHPDKAFRDEAIALGVMAVTLWRKLGIHTLFGTQILDMSQTGAREIREMIKFFNLIGHRCDELSSSMANLKGKPSLLSPDEPGSGYMGGPDQRSDAKFRSKYCPEYNRPGETGPDVRHLAEVIGNTPIAFDDAFLRTMKAFGIQHHDVLTEWKGAPGAGEAPAAAAPSPAPGAPKGPGLGGLPARDEADKVVAALKGEPGADSYRLMEITGLNALAVGRALDWLAANGDLAA